MVATIGGTSMNSQAVAAAALALPEGARMELVERLLEALGPETDGADDATFAAELQRRSAEIDRQEAELIPWSELKNEPF
jgi:putative addiction module component (TIGR02574 family)